MWGQVLLVAKTLWMFCLVIELSVMHSSLRTYRCACFMVCCLSKGQACFKGVISQSGSSAPESSERSKVSKSVLSNQGIRYFTGEHDNSRRNRNANILSISPGLFKLQIPTSRREGEEEYVNWLQSQNILFSDYFPSCSLWQTAVSMSWAFCSFFPIWQKRTSFMSFIFRQFTCVRAKMPNISLNVH